MENKHLLSLSYGKDSLACLGAIEQLGWPLDRIVHAEVWATDTIPADLPPMVEFKAKADKIIKERWGIEVEHLCATKDGERLTYEKLFYHIPKRKESTAEKFKGGVQGFPTITRPWCNGHLKRPTLRMALPKKFMVQETQRRDLSSDSPSSEDSGARATSNTGFSKAAARGDAKNTVQYLGIAADEPERIARHTKPGFRMPLVELGWDEAYCRKWCEENDLLSQIYTTTTRGGCWFCHNQGVGQLRLLRKNYPEYWALMLKWDLDSPVTFKPDGHTVHDFERRFALEDAGWIMPDERFKWSYLDEQQIDVFALLRRL